jgi:heat shock protein HtpX
VIDAGMHGLRSALIAGLAAALPVTIGWLIAGSSGVWIGLALVCVVLAIIWLTSGTILRRVFRATDARSDQLPFICDTVTRLAADAGIAPPKVAISSLRTPNAFAAATPGGGFVGVTTGLLEMLGPDELEAVLAHEIAHLAGRGGVCTTVAAALATVPGAICAANGSDLLYATSFRRGQHRIGGGTAFALLRDIAALIATPFAAIFVRASTARAAELRADRAAIALTGKPAALASALRKIDAFAGRIAAPVNPAVAHLLVVHPFGTRLGGLFDTHPPITARLAAIAADVEAAS